MMRRATLYVLVALSTACAHARAPAAAREEVVWPGPPAAPRVRLALVIPDPSGPADRPAWWSRALHAIAGTDSARSPRAALARPFGIATAAGADLVIADPDASAVVRTRPDGTFERISCPGRSWIAPMAVTFDDGGALWVADAGAGEVVRRDLDGRCRAFGTGVLERPTGVAAAQGRIYVADPPRHVVVVLSPDSPEVDRFGGRGEDEGRLSFPSSVARAPDGSVLVVDALNFRVARFSPEGRWMGAFGIAGDEGGAFARPKAVAAGPDGRVYVTDAQRDLVLVFHPDGTFDYAFGDSGAAPGSFAHPAGIWVAGGRVYVADSHNRRVQVFEILGGHP